MDSKLHQLHERHTRIDQELNNLHTQYASIEHQVGLAKHREQWHPEVNQALEALQREEHQRAVGAFERLLGALLNDILPGERQVLLELSTLAGMPSLDIALLKNEHIPDPQDILDEAKRALLNIEDPLYGSGGSVANVLSSGLRMITLIRSNHRRFLILDEADCWLKPTLISAFSKVIQEAAAHLNIQVLMISHHDQTYFQDIEHRIELRQTEHGLSTSVDVDGTQPVWEDEQLGIRSLALFGFQASESLFLPLSPGVTLLYGNNDIGKSSIVTALRAVFYGETSDALIRHESPYAKVMVCFEEEKVLTWERHRKASKDKTKGMYTLHQGSQVLHQSPKAKGVPEWLLDETGLGLIDGLDVQLRIQKEPVFLLNNPSTVRAKALAVGTEASFVQKMMELSKQDLAEAKRTIKQGEAELERLSRQIQARESIESISLTFLFEEHQRLEERSKSLKRLDELYQAWTRAQHQAKRHAWTTQVTLPVLPQLDFNPSWVEVVERWKGALVKKINRDKIESLTLPTLPSLKSDQAWMTVATQWKQAQERLERRAAWLQRADRIPTLPVLSEQQAYVEIQRHWQAQRDRMSHLKEDMKRLMDEMNVLQSSFPESCPTCGQDWPHQHQPSQVIEPIDIEVVKPPKSAALKAAEPERRRRRSLIDEKTS